MPLIAEMRQVIRDKEPYRATRKELDIWFKKLNQEVFSNKLKNFRKIKFTEMRTCWAITNGVVVWSKHSTKKKQILHTDLVLRRTFPNKKTFIEVVAHEMVHHYQWCFGDRTDVHGKTFLEWKEPLEKHHIKLRDRIGIVSKSGENGRKTLRTYV